MQFSSFIFRAKFRRRLLRVRSVLSLGAPPEATSAVAAAVKRPAIAWLFNCVAWNIFDCCEAPDEAGYLAESLR